MSTTTTDLSIIIVNWNTRELLSRCLISVLHEAQASSTGQVEIYVVDNASTDGSTDLVKERFPPVRLIENSTNVGFARANNQALRRASGEYVVLLNSDTRVLQGAFATLLRFMDEHPDAGGCGPALLNADGTLQPSCYPMRTPGREFWRLTFLEAIWPRANYPQERWGRQTPRQVEVIKGACLVLRRRALDEVGLLDDRYFMYTEEMDLCCRLLEAGLKLWWVPQAEVVHYEGASSKQIEEAMYIQLYRSKVQFHRKFGGERRAQLFKRLVRIAYFPRLLAASALRLWSPQMAGRARTYRRLLAELPGM